MNKEFAPKKQNTHEEKEKAKAYFIRHSVSNYTSYREQLLSDNPQEAVHKERQIYPDLNREGVELAKNEALSFFKKLDPTKDKLFIVSSGEARAIETASLYRDVAKELGFEILQSENTRSSLAEKIGRGDIRVLENLTPRIQNTLLMTLFYPKDKVPEINWGAVDEETKKKWQHAKQIIDTDDKGSYTLNVIAHSEKIQKIFPELEQTKQNLEIQRKNLRRLLRFLQRKTEKQKNYSLKVLAFGHDSQMALTSKELFNGEKIKNCELIEITPTKDVIEINKNGEIKTEYYE